MKIHILNKYVCMLIEGKSKMSMICRFRFMVFNATFNNISVVFSREPNFVIFFQIGGIFFSGI